MLLFIRIYNVLQMKNIVDIYTENAELTATPDNTIGMGNPMPATETTNGTEPLVRKRKNKKCKKCVDEGLLSGMDSTLQAGDDVLEFAEWFVNQQAEELKSTDVEAAMAATVAAVEFQGKDTVILDVEKAYEPIAKRFAPDRLIIKSRLWPKNIKKIIVINCPYGFMLHSYVADLSKLDVEVYKDNMRTYSNLDAAFKMATTGADIKFGSIKCDCFKMSNPKVTDITFGKNSSMLDVNLGGCEKLTFIYGRFNDAMSARLPRQYVTSKLCETGLLPWGIDLTIYN